MEQQAKRRKKSNGLTKQILRMSAKCKTIIALLILIGIFAVGYFSVILIVFAYGKITSKKYHVSEAMENGYEVRSYFDGTDCIAKNGKRRAIIKDIEWVKGSVSDSLWVVSKDGRIAYFNTNTGQLTSSFIYRKTWGYSEGVAAVLDDEYRLKFIDSQGGIVFKHTFNYNQQRDLYYQFHYQMCPMLDSVGKVGLIDTSGKWVVEPCFDSAAFISGMRGGYWSLMRNDSLTVIDSLGRILIGMTPGQQLKLTDDGDLEIWQQLYPGRLFDKSGRLLSNQTYWSVEKIIYYEDGNVTSTDVLAYYTAYDQCGLMSLGGQILTAAQYNEIEAIDKKLFRAQRGIDALVDDEGYPLHDDEKSTIYVLLNDKGELVEGRSVPHNLKKQQ
ncbi:MAG: WG repeat-containing protein [Bacteroidales bacterium]|nr:WG repeat-containing protein [Bacteroidales bacterium]